MMTFDLHNEIRDVLHARPDLTSTHDVAAEVAARVPSREVRATLAVALRSLVRETMGAVRRSPGPVATEPVHLVSTPRPDNSGRSKRVEAIREDHWRLALLGLYSTGPTADDRKRLGDCTSNDLLFIETYHRNLAKANSIRADWVSGIREAMIRRQVNTVADLPDETLATLLADT